MGRSHFCPEVNLMFWSINESLLRSVAPYLLTMLVLALYGRRLMSVMAQARMGQARLQPESAVSDQGGASAVEMVMLLPLLLALLLTILQVALIVQAKFVVNYAAFCAARSAIVAIPSKVQGAGGVEERNRLNLHSNSSPKMGMIHRAAALPCVAISPVWSTGILLATLAPLKPEVAVQMEELALLFPASREDTNISQQLVARAHYAFDPANTRVEIFGEGGDQSGSFGEQALVRVRVTFRYYLTVPFANRLFGTSYYGIKILNGFGLLNQSGLYAPITEEYTMVNEGEPPFPRKQDPGEVDFKVGG
jgi:Flp pilus assembly protein TadG